MPEPNPQHNPVLKATIYEMLDNQLQNEDPPETRATLERLLAEDHDQAEARRLLACVITGEIFTILKSKKPFNRDRFVERLAMLPETPWLDDEE